MTSRHIAVAVATAASLCLAALTPAAAAPARKPLPRDPGTAPTAVVTVDNETPVLYDDKAGGNASGDDPAIWVDPVDSTNSIVIATAKKGGLRVYDLADRELQDLPSSTLPEKGRYNNVDIAYGIQLGGRTVDLAVVSDRYNDTIRFFTIDPAGAKAVTPLVEVTAKDNDWLFVKDAAELAEGHTAYGLAVYQPTRGKDAGRTFIVVTREGRTTLALAELVPHADGTVGYETVRTWDMPSTFQTRLGPWSPCTEPGVGPQLEGVTVDQRTGTLYAAQELVGLWRIELEQPRKQPRLVDTVTTFGTPATYDEATEECVAGEDRGLGGNIVADAEGVDLYYADGANGYVVLSNQGGDTFTVYDRKTSNRYLGRFAVKGINGVDDINGSDGLAITNRPGGSYTQGLLVSHDEPETGASVDGDRDATNFSYVQWGDIAEALGLKVSTRAGNDPRFR